MDTGPIVAIDIETETSPCHVPPLECCSRRGLDPSVTPITAVGVSTAGKDRVLLADDNASEAQLLRDLDALMAASTGTLVTWNGAVFDLPFLADRYKLHGLSTGLQLVADPNLPVKYSPTPGHAGGYQATWYDLRHLDIMKEFKDTARQLGVSWSLKPLAIALGHEPVEVDRRAMHLLSASELEEYVASDARITRLLAEMHSSGDR